MASMRLWLFAPGIFPGPFGAIVNATDLVDDLARKICELNSELGNPARLQMHKITGIKLDDDNLAQRIDSESNSSSPLKAHKMVGFYFNPPTEDELRVIVEHAVVDRSRSSSGDQTNDQAEEISVSNALKNARILRETIWGKNYRHNTQIILSSEYRFYDSGPFRWILGGILQTHFLARKEYVLAYDYVACMVIGERGPNAPSFVLTGQPGIGKSTFIAYVLIRRLMRRLPTAVQIGPNIFVVFDNQMARVYNTGDEFSFCVPDGAWALSDSSSTVSQPCGAFIKATQAVVIQVTSPAAQRWKSWAKERTTRTYVMDVWTQDEIHAVLSQHQLASSHELADQFCNKYGPCARTIFYLCKKPSMETAHIKSVHKAANYAARAEPTVIIRIQNLDFGSDAALYSLIFVRPESHEVRTGATAYIPTEYLIERFTDAALLANNSELPHLFAQMTIRANTRTTAGWMYENFVHAQFTTSGDIYALDSKGTSVKIQTTDSIVPGTVSALRSARPPLYWRPGLNNFPGMDAILRTTTETWAIQVAIGDQHSTAEKGLEKVLDILGNVVKKQLCLLVVGPSLQNVQSVIDKMKTWNDIPMYACALDYDEDRSKCAPGRQVAYTIGQSHAPRCPCMLTVNDINDLRVL